MSFKNAQDAVLKATNKVFGDDVIYTYASDSTTAEIKGVFDNAFIEINGISTKKPILRIRLADLAAEPADTDTATINSVVYIVRDHEPDNFGGTTLILEKN